VQEGIMPKTLCFRLLKHIHDSKKDWAQKDGKLKQCEPVKKMIVHAEQRTSKHTQQGMNNT
jgi:hypothetical protein